MPKVIRVSGFDIYFWSNENGEPVHFHIAKGNHGSNNTKFWVLSNGSIMMAHNKSRYKKKELANLLITIQELGIAREVVREWKEKFGYLKFVS